MRRRRRIRALYIAINQDHRWIRPHVDHHQQARSQSRKKPDEKEESKEAMSGIGGCKKAKQPFNIQYVVHQSSPTQWNEGSWVLVGFLKNIGTIKPECSIFERVRNGNVHICAKAPEDAFTVRPKVDKARKEPSKIKWMSASNV